MTYRIWCIYDKQSINPLTGRVGRWRVVWYQPALEWMDRVHVGSGVIAILAENKHQYGSFINPKKAMGL